MACHVSAAKNLRFLTIWESRGCFAAFTLSGNCRLFVLLRATGSEGLSMTAQPVPRANYLADTARQT
jgi:hypothetical protein